MASAMAGLTAFFLIRFLAICASLFTAMRGEIGARSFGLLAFRPFALLAVSWSSCLLWRYSKNKAYSLLKGIAACAFGYVLWAYVHNPYRNFDWASISQRMVHIAVVWISVAVARIAGAAMNGGRRSSTNFFWAGVAGFGFGVCGLALIPISGDEFSKVNGLGLVSNAASTVETQDYSAQDSKDHYPVCRFRFNSLGYRDEEPSPALRKGRRRVLLVGDSCIWGDGIADNEETLGYLLRAELQRLSPGRFDVMSAASPGLGLYGYGRIVDGMSLLYPPDVLVVSYHGGDDQDPLDPQLLCDAVPTQPLLKKLFVTLLVPQHLQEASAAHSRFIRGSPEVRRYFSNWHEEFARKAQARRSRVLFLRTLQFERHDLPSPIELVDLPLKFRYPNHDLWYGKDVHPKPKLNRILARLLAAKIVGRS